MVEGHTTESAKRTTTKKAAQKASRSGHYRELHDEEIFEEDPETPGEERATHVTKTSSWDIGIPAGLTHAWDHVINAEKEFVMAFLSLLGLDEDLAERVQRRRSAADKRRHEEHIEVREVHVK